MKRMKYILFIILFSFAINVYADYPKGDVNGNNKVDSADYILVRKHILKQTSLTGDKKTRADVNNDGKISSLDFVAIRKIIINGESTSPTSTPTMAPTPTPSATPKPTATPIVSATKIELDKSRIYLKLGNGDTVKATITPSNASDKSIKWTSSNEKVVTVDNGLIKANTKYLGDAIITATTSNGKTASVRVTVTSVGIDIKNGKFSIIDSASKVSFGSNAFDLRSEYEKCLEQAKAKYKKIGKIDVANASSKNDTKIHFIDIGRGDATLLEHNGHYGLIDTGLADSNLVKYLKNVIGNNRLDFILLTHWHSDHVGEIYALFENNFIDSNTTYYFIKNANLVSDKESKETAYHQYYCNVLVGMKQRIDNDNNIKYLTNQKDYVIKLGDDSFKVYVFGNDIPNNGYYSDESTEGKLNDENRNSLGALVVYNNKNVLITGDMGEGDEYRVASKISDLKTSGIIKSNVINVYKMGHHGSTSAAYTPLIDYIMPESAIISNEVGKIQPYGNMNLSTMCYMQYQYDTKLYLTGNTKNGSVVYDFSNNKFYDGNGKESISGNKSPLNLCTKNEENGVKTILFDKATGSNYKNKTCDLYLEYGNFIVGKRDNKEYIEEGAAAKDKYRAPGRICK